ncbi:MAG: class I SAM-dependent methyltransferase [Sphingobacteriaceae bacterium]|nr:MAG: class I SAM-dependent methyltransferase [Sphingobacteriaceae bacterium]
MVDALGQAIFDHYHQLTPDTLWIHNQYGPKEEMPVDTFFRDVDDMPDMELFAINECSGKVLDIGAGAGSHALFLQNRNVDVTAIDISPLAVQVMQERGVKKAFEADIYTYHPGKFDTLLLLMNGIGLAGDLDGLKKLLTHFKSLLNTGGQILFDSSDINYLYERKLPTDKYYGEISYQYEYKQLKTNWFKWLYIDEQTLTLIAAEVGFKAEVLVEDEYDQYLVRLTQF